MTEQTHNATVAIKKFVFSPFQENTYVLSVNQVCWIIDPGCYFAEEKDELKAHIAANALRPARLINTHCHLDHVFGNRFVYERYGLLPELHALDSITLAMAKTSANLYGLTAFEESPVAEAHLSEGTTLHLGGVAFEVVFVPGHAPGHIALVCHTGRFVIGGDVLFLGSVGRTDLPGGDFRTLEKSIREQFYTLPDDYTVFSGHGSETTIGAEKRSNPFISQF